MTLMKTLAAGAALTTLVSLTAGMAMAQSTGTSAVEEVVVTGARTGVEGLIKLEEAAKSRSSISQEYIETQAAGQTVLQTINSLPGVNFTNDDPYGNAGGNLRMRSFDKQRISLTVDGIPLNDTGNYQIYPNQQPDPEVLDQVTVNLGSTDVDSPTASATGGTVAYRTAMPKDDFGGEGTFTLGSYDYQRVFGRIDTGEIGPWGTTAFLSASYVDYDKFRGYGELQKTQVNARIMQPLREADYVSLVFHYNRNRNNSYRSASRADFAANGYGFDYIRNYVRDEPTAGVADNDGAGSSSNPNAPASASNYYGLRINPSDTANIHANSLFHLTDNLTLTVDPSFQYVLANGGTQSVVITETDRRLRGTSAAAGVDLNGDGDLLDSVRVMNPSNTNTRRFGLTSSLIWEFMPSQTLRGSYTLDYGRHRQTGEYSTINQYGEYDDVFGGKDGHGAVIRTADGSILRRRDRASIAELQQFALQYRGKFLEDKLLFDLGLSAKYFSRELNQFCYYRASQVFGANEYCTTNPVGDANVTGARAPYQTTVKYDKVLPNVGVTYRPFGDAHLLYASYSQNLSAPRTDDLYDVQLPNSRPEETESFDVGYRYQGGKLLGSVALWKTDYTNRIVRAFNEDLGISITRNVGDVELYGVDGELAWRPTGALTFYGSAAYTHSEVLSDVRLSATQVLPTQGKKLVETPEYSGFLRGEYEIAGFTFGLQAKYVGKRPATDVNDEFAEAYTVADLDVRYDLENLGLPKAWVQLNVTNLADEKYFGSISSGTNTNPIATTGGTIAASVPFYQIGAPRTVQVSVHAEF